MGHRPGISKAMKLWQRAAEARLRREVVISEQWCGFILRKNTTDVMFVLIDGDV